MADAVGHPNKKKRKKRKHARKNKNEALNKRQKKDDDDIEILSFDEFDEPSNSDVRQPDWQSGRPRGGGDRKAIRGSEHKVDSKNDQRERTSSGHKGVVGDDRGRCVPGKATARLFQLALPSNDQRSRSNSRDGRDNNYQRNSLPLHNEWEQSNRYRIVHDHSLDRHNTPAVASADVERSQTYRRARLDQQDVLHNSNFQQNLQDYSPINQTNYPMQSPNQSDGYANINSFIAYPNLSVPQNPIHETGSFSRYYGFENHDVYRLENEYRVLQEENQRLKMALVNVISEPGDIKPEVQVTFKHEGLAERFRLRIESFIEDLFLKEGYAIKDLFLEKPLFRTNDTSAVENYCNSSVPLYDVDSNVSVDQDNTSNARNNFSIRSTTCFNCSGNHFMYECPEVLCPQRIAENRAERLATTAIQNVRYHKKENVQEIYKPGAISDDLRRALNLDRDQVPLYIYRMRVCGYPPGWLEEAAVKSSGLAMYGLQDDGPVEESQNAPQNQQAGSRIQYDCDKLIDFPGFNVPLPPNFVDESEHLGLPPFQQSQSRSLMENSVEKSVIRPKRRKELEANSHQKSTTVIHTDEDMEVVDECSDDFIVEETKSSKLDFIPPLPADDGYSFPLPPLPSSPLPPLPSSPLPPLPSSPLPPPPPTTPPPDFPSTMSVAFAESLEDTSLSSVNSVSEVILPVVVTFDSKNVEVNNNTSSSSVTVIGDNLQASCITLSSESRECIDSSSLPSFPCSISPDHNAELSKLELKIPSKTGKELNFIERLDSVNQPFRDSPSLDELEEKKRLIMLALTNAVDEDDTEIKNFSSPGDHSAESAESAAKINESYQIQESANSSRRSLESASSFLGSPVVPAFTTFRRLPNFEKFGEGIQDHLPYENIPNSTGTYEQMKLVLKEVKEKMARLKE